MFLSFQNTPWLHLSKWSTIVEAKHGTACPLPLSKNQDGLLWWIISLMRNHDLDQEQANVSNLCCPSVSLYPTSFSLALHQQKSPVWLCRHRLQLWMGLLYSIQFGVVVSPPTICLLKLSNAWWMVCTVVHGVVIHNQVLACSTPTEKPGLVLQTYQYSPEWVFSTQYNVFISPLSSMPVGAFQYMIYDMWPLYLPSLPSYKYDRFLKRWPWDMNLVHD